jgi:transposase
MQTTSFFPGTDAVVATGDGVGVNDNSFAAPRLRRPDRQQTTLEPCCLDDRLPPDHPARTIWKVVERLDLSAFYTPIAARGSDPGRAATDPKLLVAVWLYAAVEGVGSGRELDRLCREHDAYRWLCGGVSLNDHTLNDFRVAHGQALDDLFTKVLASLMHHDVVKVNRISQDGTRVRASAGKSSFRRLAEADDFGGRKGDLQTAGFDFGDGERGPENVSRFACLHGSRVGQSALRGALVRAGVQRDALRHGADELKRGKRGRGERAEHE